jgi:hypothetical protein
VRAQCGAFEHDQVAIRYASVDRHGDPCVHDSVQMTHFDRATMESMFNDIKLKTDWPVDTGECLWGYFFIDIDRKKLESAGRLLQGQGYRYVDIFAAYLPDEDPEVVPYFFLHVGRIEHHTIETLMARNEQLSDFARSQNLQSYDGMDVGAVG